MGVEKAEPQEQIRGLDEDRAAEVLAPWVLWISSEKPTQALNVQRFYMRSIAPKEKSKLQSFE